jgi:hypothetical protein
VCEGHETALFTAFKQAAQLFKYADMAFSSIEGCGLPRIDEGVVAAASTVMAGFVMSVANGSSEVRRTNHRSLD